MLQSLRVYIKYRLRDEQDLRYIAQKVEEINKYIVQYSFVDIVQADKLQKRAVELSALSTVALQAKRDWEEQLAVRGAKEIQLQKRQQISEELKRKRASNRKKLTRGMKALGKS